MATAAQNQTSGTASTFEQLWNSVLSFCFGEPRNYASAALLDAASAVDAAADDLQHKNRAEIADAVRSAADWLDDTGKMLLRAAPEDATEMIADFAKDRPAVYLAGAAALGASAALWIQYQSGTAPETDQDTEHGGVADTEGADQ